ncbi:MAG: SUMF1/EgtB/PvdO family nonheme iron enzyme [Kiritimatiellia bacterium]|nr:SUMF1/EgtB/PvdO family nonheme iron enzyme [Kiritimatiellia bacterium]
MRTCRKWAWCLILGFAISLCCAEAKPKRKKKKIAPVSPVLEQLQLVNPAAMRRALVELERMFPDRYPASARLAARIDELEEQLPSLIQGCRAMPDQATLKRTEALFAFQRELLVERNPLVDFDRLMLIRRRSKDGGGFDLGLPDNASSNPQVFTSGKKSNSGMDNEIVMFSLKESYKNYSVVYRPEDPDFVGDIDLHWDAEKILFSQGNPKRFDLYEMGLSDPSPQKVTTIPDADVANFDGCYMANDDIAFMSTGCFKAVPCLLNSDVANMFRLYRDSGEVRQLTFEQDQDWCPTMAPDGSLLYLRWEYAGISHFGARILFRMNPDGTNQRPYIGRGEYWPNAIFFARPCPGADGKVIGIVSGHHGVHRMGELVLFDANIEGSVQAVQKIPGFGKEIIPKIEDHLVDDSWPKFLHPVPLGSESQKELAAKFFLVSARIGPGSSRNFSIYLTDIYDNMVLLATDSDPEIALLEPLPVKKTQRVPLIPDRINPDSKEATVFIQDIYVGQGLKGIPRGSVKKLRIIEYHHAYRGMSGKRHQIGLDGPWDIQRILGTVDVEEDGSAYFKIPANQPVALQPITEEGDALALMRSWLTGMPGESVSCVGCHEALYKAPVDTGMVKALQSPPQETQPWYGPARGFSFDREVQPVLDHYCIGCHDGSSSKGTTLDLRRGKRQRPPNSKAVKIGTLSFSPSYFALRKYVRGHTMEGDIRTLMPTEHRANTTRLVQLLKKGHHGVELDPEAWERLYAWIDLNTPCWGTWGEATGQGKIPQKDRRVAILNTYASVDAYDPEAIHPVSYTPQSPKPATKVEQKPAPAVTCVGWPFEPEEAPGCEVTLPGYGAIRLKRIPAGQFVMGDPEGHPADRNLKVAKIKSDLWMAETEVSNALYNQFDAEHNSRLEPGDNSPFYEEDIGFPCNEPNQPVVRVSQERAVAFCEWLSEKTGKAFRLPTEAEWEYACRAGSDSPLWWGEAGAGFTAYANLADRQLGKEQGIYGGKSIRVPAWRPAVMTLDDGYHVAAPVGTFAPNAWGLYDMHGNVAEWTSSPVKGRDVELRTVRGGSWYNLPKQATAGHRMWYPKWQPVYDVGFRVVMVAE